MIYAIVKADFPYATYMQLGWRPYYQIMNYV